MGGRGSSIGSLVGKHHCLESDASCYREPVEVTEEGGPMGELWQVVHESCCGIIYAAEV